MRTILTICFVVSFQMLYGQFDETTTLHNPATVLGFGRKIDVAKDESVLVVGNTQEVLTFFKSNDVWQLEGNSIPSRHSDFHLTDNGKTLAVFHRNTDNKRIIELFNRKNGQWVKKGKPIKQISNDEFPYLPIQFSADGNTFIVSGVKRVPDMQVCHLCNPNIETVRIYEWNGTDWQLKGSPLNGNGPGDNFGTTVAISADKSTIAIGSIYKNFIKKPKGKVEVFRFLNGQWIKKGETIRGLHEHEYFGSHISLDESGQHLSVFSFNRIAPDPFRAVQLEYDSYSINYRFQHGNWIAQSNAAVLSDKLISKFHIFNSGTVLLYSKDGYALFRFDDNSWNEQKVPELLFHHNLGWSDNNIFVGDAAHNAQFGIVHIYPDIIN